MKKTSYSVAGLVATFKNNLPSYTLLFIGFIIGILWLGALRFWLVKPAEETHYHANFAVYIDGSREEFKSFTYYEEEVACTTAFADNPKGRAHMHDNVNDVIHVHDKRVTYANFFENISWSIGPSFVRADTKLITNTDTEKWVYILNDQKVDRIDNRIIGDQDKLLVSYGPSDTDFMAQYNKIENKAAQHDSEQDPTTCSGLNGPIKTSFGVKLKHAFSLRE